MATGTIKTLVKDRGFGFIQAAGSSNDIFFHRTSVTQGSFDDLMIGQSVEFETEPDPRDARRTRAVDVRSA